MTIRRLSGHFDSHSMPNWASVANDSWRYQIDWFYPPPSSVCLTWYLSCLLLTNSFAILHFLIIEVYFLNLSHLETPAVGPEKIILETKISEESNENVSDIKIFIFSNNFVLTGSKVFARKIFATRNSSPLSNHFSFNWAQAFGHLVYLVLAITRNLLRRLQHISKHPNLSPKATL